jgi:hypothetical protein
MPTQKQLAASQLYANLMEEIKIRISAIDAGTGGTLLVEPPFVREFCFLQIRMVCELIALGCLVAHGDIAATDAKRLHKQWAADKIMDELGALHPEFFPYPMRQGRNAIGHTLDAINPSPLPKSELLRLYWKCGDVLHRGSLKKILSGRIPIQIHYPEITALAQKINDLLEVHALFMAGADMAFICVLRNSDDNFRVQVAIGERRGLPQS